MKHHFAIALFLLVATLGKATVHVVTCQNGSFHFLPVTVNASVGDTIHWTWVSGNHIVGLINSTDIPSGAAQWNAPINSSQTDFEYVLTTPGTYHYVCHPGSPHGEDGYIQVDAATSVPFTEVAYSGARLFPNPFVDQFTLETSGANKVVLHNLLGEAVGSYDLSPVRTTIRIEPGALPKGVYFCSLMRNGVVLETKRLEKQ